MLALPCPLPGALHPTLARPTGSSSSSRSIPVIFVCGARAYPPRAGRRPKPCTAPIDSAYLGWGRSWSPSSHRKTSLLVPSSTVDGGRATPPPRGLKKPVWPALGRNSPPRASPVEGRGML